jgi:hypothetical protein
MWPGKVSIAPTIQGKITSRFEDKSLASRAFEAAGNHLCSCSMALLWVRSEASNL